MGTRGNFCGASPKKAPQMGKKVVKRPPHGKKRPPQGEKRKKGPLKEKM